MNIAIYIDLTCNLGSAIFNNAAGRIHMGTIKDLIIGVILECINILNILIHNILAGHLYTIVTIFPALIIVIHYELIDYSPNNI